MPKPPKIIVVGHGWPDLDERQNPVLLAVERLRSELPSIEAAFIKADPQLEAVINRDSIVVPFFMSSGFFVSTVLPGLVGDARVLEPVGIQPGMTQVVDDVLAPHYSSNAILVLVGHGTPRHKTSKTSVEAQAQRLSDQGMFKKVEIAFIDDSPALSELAFPGNDVVVLPYFAAPGPHTRVDIPEASQRLQREAKSFSILDPLGLAKGIPALIRQLLTQ